MKFNNDTAIFDCDIFNDMKKVVDSYDDKHKNQSFSKENIESYLEILDKWIHTYRSTDFNMVDGCKNKGFIYLGDLIFLKIQLKLQIQTNKDLLISDFKNLIENHTYFKPNKGVLGEELYNQFKSN
jgi:hypothetical protein